MRKKKNSSKRRVKAMRNRITNNKKQEGKTMTITKTNNKTGNDYASMAKAFHDNFMRYLEPLGRFYKRKGFSDKWVDNFLQMQSTLIILSDAVAEIPDQRLKHIIDHAIGIIVQGDFSWCLRGVEELKLNDYNWCTPETRIERGEVSPPNKAQQATSMENKIMTPEHPDWQDFLWLLDNLPLCYQRFYNTKISKCDQTLKITKGILETFRDVDVEKSLEYIKQHLGSCDCQVVGHVIRSHYMGTEDLETVSTFPSDVRLPFEPCQAAYRRQAN